MFDAEIDVHQSISSMEGLFFSLSGWRVAPLVLDVTNQERYVQWRQVYFTCHQICAKNLVPVRLGNPDPGTLDLEASPRLNRMEVDFHGIYYHG